MPKSIKHAKSIKHYLLPFSFLALSACQNKVYQTPSGLQFITFHTNTTETPASGGATVKTTYTVRHNDSILRTTNGHLPLYHQLIPGLIFPYTPVEVLAFGVRMGDSVIVTQRVDSMIRKGQLKQLPPGWKASDELTTTMTVLAIFPFTPGHNDSAVGADKRREAESLLAAAAPIAKERVRHWLRQQGRTATQTADGTFLDIMMQGTGPQIDSGSNFNLHYTISSLSGKIRDSNEDTSFHHSPLLPIKLGNHMLPPSIDRTLRGQHIGTTLRIYAPAGTDITPAMVVQQGGIHGNDEVWLITIDQP